MRDPRRSSLLRVAAAIAVAGSGVAFANAHSDDGESPAVRYPVVVFLVRCSWKSLLVF